MPNKTFNIPQPIITDQNCEYFAVRYRKIQPVVSPWTSIGNITVNDFTIDIDNNSIYEIEAIHHCCDGSDSQPTTVTFNTSTNSASIYVCMVETLVSDTCAVTPGNCRNCNVTKSYKVKFFQNGNATTPLSLQNNNLKLTFQEIVDGVPLNPVEIQMQAGITEYNYGNVTTYEESCTNGNSVVSNRSLSLLDGNYASTPYFKVHCASNFPTLNQTSNTSTGAGGIRTQKFQVGIDILPGNKYQLTAYNVTKELIAVQGDTPTSIAQKLTNAINTTTANQWNQFGTAPVGQNGFPPTATSSGSVITINLNHQNIFTAQAYEY